MIHSVRDLRGEKFGRLLVKSRAKNIGRQIAWLCQCDCGNKTTVRGAQLTRRRNAVKSCGCLRDETSRKNGINCRKISGKANFNCLYYDYKYSAKVRELSFRLNETQFRKLVAQNCAYCGVGPNQIYHKKGTYGKFIYNGIDRIDNKKGYTIKNCVPCCKFCNYAKKRGTRKEFLNWIKRLMTLGR